MQKGYKVYAPIYEVYGIRVSGMESKFVCNQAEADTPNGNHIHGKP